MTIIAQEGDRLQVYNPWGSTTWVSEDDFINGHMGRLPTVISPMRTASIFRGSRGGAAIAAAALLALATGCDSGTDEPAGGSTSTASHPTSRPVKDTSITAEPGERFTLTVDQNASTREYWYLVDPKPDSSVLVSHGQDHASDSGDEPEPGAGGRLTFTFEAKGKGTTRFTLLHCTFTTCQGNTSTRPPRTTGPSATPTTGEATPSQVPERITYTVTVG
ncbi:protease inhibitor I42 family protein [Streptomyces sp. NRRL S-813]|uniref:protease inhibitor I42 family protein n=1 Tax=Streptomyces sp. NRRL S-813 TaxID=1463919 RepID=UPI000AA07B45|nr:protease inhibitor I42 family protein [Streptomyces sp. NRRL S-813]